MRKRLRIANRKPPSRFQPIGNYVLDSPAKTMATAATLARSRRACASISRRRALIRATSRANETKDGLGRLGRVTIERGWRIRACSLRSPISWSC